MRFYSTAFVPDLRERSIVGTDSSAGVMDLFSLLYPFNSHPLLDFRDLELCFCGLDSTRPLLILFLPLDGLHGTRA